MTSDEKKILAGKVALVTGGSRGIGRAIAEAYALAGAAVFICGRDENKVTAAVEAIRHAGGDIDGTCGDIGNFGDVERIISAALRRFGTIHVLVNNGGILGPRETIADYPPDAWDEVLRINLTGLFLMTRAVLPVMMEQRSGSIINVTSHLGLMGSIKPAYAATKGGIISFTRTLAAQYAAHHIRANAIAPGSVRTERQIRRYENAEWAQSERTSRTARERVVAQKLYPYSVSEPADIAAIALFLASDDSRTLTGTTIAADGGRSSYLKFHAGDE